jgi:hypothetical protein
MGLKGGGATVAWALVLPFALGYTALDSVLGIAWGSLPKGQSDSGPIRLRPAGSSTTYSSPNRSVTSSTIPPRSGTARS